MCANLAHFVGLCRARYILGNMKIYFHILQFLNIGVTAEILPRRRPFCLAHRSKCRAGIDLPHQCVVDSYKPAYSIPWLRAGLVFIWNIPFQRQKASSLIMRTVSLQGPQPSFVTPTWRCHQMETFSMLLAICAGNLPVTGKFPAQRPVTRSVDVFFDLCLNERWWLVIWDLIAPITTSL